MAKKEALSPLEVAVIEIGAAAKIVKMLREIHTNIDRDNHGEESAQSNMRLIEDLIQRIEGESWRK